MAKKKRVPMPEDIDLDLMTQIFQAFDDLTDAREVADDTKESAKKAREAADAAQERVNDLLREARYGQKGLPFSKGEED